MCSFLFPLGTLRIWQVLRGAFCFSVRRPPPALRFDGELSLPFSLKRFSWSPTPKELYTVSACPGQGRGADRSCEGPWFSLPTDGFFLQRGYLPDHDLFERPEVGL